ncbi:Amino acid/polyamine transporter I [Penicillium expansum]|uniref:Amino acid/polyamine transporter I n=1 Tax=Penicillium expansum TaxID=27334 RepID=A0A0A2JM07_PENEN|nr:Amino acid/polyamine transporter I [Penicillium expansum]KGO39926.1 Amino acid/polyamine transporter I [Penicillium expansum]KGO53310.1 Amino acid/polyamine transporter I [Penicillium expansum]
MGHPDEINALEAQPNYNDNSGDFKETEQDEPVQLRRELKARHISMIAIGGAIGTGLVVGTGSALTAGPGSLLIAYCFMGFVVWTVMCGLGEMAAWLPLSSGFTGYAGRFCDPALGFTLGWCYYLKYIILPPTQLTAAALVITYWPKTSAENVNPGVWIAIFMLAIIVINYFGVKIFGELEFWLSSFKVIVILGLILCSFIFALGGGPDHDRRGFRYWSEPGAFATKYTGGSLGKFLAFWSTMVQATFAFLGTELIGVTVGEAQNPRKTIPKAIKLTFWRILVFYILSVLFLGMLVPYNSPDLVFATKAKSSAAASPFVVAMKQVAALPHIINGCILVFVFSAANSDLYIATRTLYGLAREKKAPKIFARTNRAGVPIYALALSSSFCLLAFMSVSSGSKAVFGYFTDMVSIFGLLTWISLLITHIFFVRARRAQGVDEATLAYKAPLGIIGSCVALFFCVLVAFTRSFGVFVHKPETYGDFDYKTFITSYIGIPLYVMAFAGWKLWKRTEIVKPHNADIWTGKAEIDREEAEYTAMMAIEDQNLSGWNKVYRKSLAWLF